MDETYIKVKGKYCYLYRAIGNSGKPGIINSDKSGSNIGAIRVYNLLSFSKIVIRQNICTALSSKIIVLSKRRILNGLGFAAFESAKRTLSGIEVVHMLRKVNPGITMFKSFCS